MYLWLKYKKLPQYIKNTLPFNTYVKIKIYKLLSKVCFKKHFQEELSFICELHGIELKG